MYAFGSIDQRYLIRTLLDSGVEKLYCELIADIYEESHFEVICGQQLSKEFELPIGTKTGPLSTVLFIIVLDKSLKEVHHLAILNQNIQDEKKISPSPVSGYADDTTFISYFENVLKSMLDKLLDETKDSGLSIRPDKCAIFMNKDQRTAGIKVKVIDLHQ